MVQDSLFLRNTERNSKINYFQCENNYFSFPNLYLVGNLSLILHLYNEYKSKSVFYDFVL